MAHLVKIGNSQGVRIPKPLIEQARLEGKDLKILVVSEGVLITPRKGVREGWKEAISASLTEKGGEPLDHEWLDAPLSSGDGLDW